MQHPVLTAAEMSDCDQRTIQSGVPSSVLMERAAQHVAYQIPNYAPPSTEGPILFLCGSGNNGGDGLAAARLLAQSPEYKARIRIVYTGYCDANGTPDRSRMSIECARQFDHVLNIGLTITSLGPDVMDQLNAVPPALVVDAVFGIGLCRPIEGLTADLFHAINQARLPVLAVDIPSGLSADTGAVATVALKARCTVTMQALKRGLLLGRGADYSGHILIAPIGVTLDRTTSAPPFARLADDHFWKAAFPPRKRVTHKGSYGRLLLIAGSKTMSGAACLAAESALRCGVGLVDVATPQNNRPILQSRIPEILATPYDPDAPDLRLLAHALNDCDGIVIGCGLGTDATAQVIMRLVLNTPTNHPPMPLVIDADGLNLLAAYPDLWNTPRLRPHAANHPFGPVVLTPHPAEMARLCRCGVRDILDYMAEYAQDLAVRHGVYVVLKHAHTLTATPTGELWIHPHGNAGMATGGAGDVLAGILGAVLTQQMLRTQDNTPEKDDLPHVDFATAVAAAVTLHGLAGEEAARQVGEYSLCASDLIQAIPRLLIAQSHSETKISTL